MAGSPIVPSNSANPVGQTVLIRKTLAVIYRQMDQLKAWLLRELEGIPRREVANNARQPENHGLPFSFLQNRQYIYEISPERLRFIVAEIARQLGGVPSAELVEAVRRAYENGTALAAVNLATIADDYARTISQVLSSAPYQRRAALVGARAFEEMRKFSGDAGAELGRILQDAIERGLAPREVAKDIAGRFDIARSRAKTIARTEIMGAARRGRLDESEDASEKLGLRTGMLWLSALSPTTRPSHAFRHGRIYTVDQVREFYARDANGINCKCGQTEILLKADGTPLTPGVVARVRRRR